MSKPDIDELLLTDRDGGQLEVAVLDDGRLVFVTRAPGKLAQPAALDLSQAEQLARYLVGYLRAAAGGDR